MLITTTPGIEGHPVTEYLGVVTAQGTATIAASENLSISQLVDVQTRRSARLIGIGSVRLTGTTAAQ